MLPWQEAVPDDQNLLIIDATCHMWFWRATSEGKANDKSRANLEGNPLPRGSGLSQDRGFQGATCAGITIVQPQKNPLGEHSPHRRRRPIVRSRPCTSVSNTPLAV